MRPTTVTLLVVLGLILLMSWWFATFEKTTREEFVGFTGQAAYNKFFAAESVLREVGVDAQSVATLKPNTWLPDTTDTLLLTLDESIVPLGDVMAQWVGGGGHLIIMPGRTPELLQQFLGGALQAAFVPVASDDEQTTTDEGVEQPEDFDYLVDLEQTLHRIELADSAVASATLEDEKGVIVARVNRGYGIVTLVATEHYFLNASLPQNDHARLLLDIAVGYYDAEKVWFVYNNSFDSLWTYIWENLPLTVLALVLAFLLWITAILPRFGPPIRRSISDRRSLMEHIVAAGTFEWKHTEREALAASSIDGLLGLAELRHPGIERLSKQKQAERLAAISGLPAQDIADALDNADGFSPRGFTRHMQTLQELRDRL